MQRAGSFLAIRRQLERLPESLPRHKALISISFSHTLDIYKRNMHFIQVIPTRFYLLHKLTRLTNLHPSTQALWNMEETKQQEVFRRRLLKPPALLAIRRHRTTRSETSFSHLQSRYRRSSARPPAHRPIPNWTWASAGVRPSHCPLCLRAREKWEHEEAALW